MGTTALGGQLLVDAAGGAVQIFLGATQRTVPVDRPGDLGADVAEGDGAGALSQHAGVVQRLHPQLPILTTHHGDGIFDFLLGGRLDLRFDDGVLVGVDGSRAVGLADRLEHGALHFTAVRQLAHRRGQRVDDEVDFAHVGLDQLDGLGACLVGEGIAVDGLAVEAFLLGELVEGGRVVPACGAGLLLGARLLEEHAQSIGAITEGCRDACREAIAAGRTDHQHLLRTTVTLVTDCLAGDGDLLGDILLAALGMCGGADEATNLGFDDHVKNLVCCWPGVYPPMRYSLHADSRQWPSLDGEAYREIGRSNPVKQAQCQLMGAILAAVGDAVRPAVMIRHLPAYHWSRPRRLPYHVGLFTYCHSTAVLHSPLVASRTVRQALPRMFS